MADSSTVCNTIDGVEIAPNSNTTGLSNFVNEACSDMTFRGLTYQPLPEMTKDNLAAQDINAFFSRPRRLWSGNYTSTYPDDKTMWSDFVGSTYLKAWHYEKMKGAFGYRATFCYKVVFTATPFHGGIARLTFEPTSGIPTTRHATITGASQLPGVDIDLSESTSGVIKVPWVSPLNFLPVEPPTNVSQKNNTLGTVALTRLTESIVADGAQVPTWTIWTWLEDLELIGARAAQVSVFPEAQAGKFEKSGSTAAKEAAAIPGNISNVLSAGSKLTMWLGTRVPLISSYAGPLSWVLRESAKIASSYGWSKPIDAKPSSKVYRTANISQWNSDTPYTGYNLGLFAENAVCAYPGFAGTDLDEMSFDYILSTSAAICAPTFSKTDVVGTILYSCALCPDSMKLSTTTTNTSSEPLGYKPIWVAPPCGMSKLFELYRGSFKFRIKLAKTCYHTGRLLVGFNPTSRTNSEVTYVPTDRAPNLDFYEPIAFKSVIWDLRDQNTLDFECPFQAPQSYLPVDRPYGDFFVRVLDKLESPDTVASTLRFVVEVSCVPGFEFAVPRTPDYALYPNGNQVVAQAGKFEPTKCTDGTEASHYCIGERICSVKQLLLRSCLYSVANVGSTTQVYSEVTYPTMTAGPGQQVSGEIRDYLNWIGSAFVYKRGSICVTAVATGPNTMITAFHGLGQSIDMSPIVTEHTGSLHVKMPYYSPVSRSCTSTDSVLQDYETLDWVTVTVAGSADTPPVVIYRSVADDFQLGGFIGFPPIMLANTSKNSNSLKSALVRKT